MHNNIKKIKIISIIQLILIIILIPSIQSQYSNSITIEGYVYINNIKIIPDQVSLVLPDEMRYATILDNGNYKIILPISEQVTGTFYIWYQNNWYDGGKITLSENTDYYENDLYITTGFDDGETKPTADAGGPYFRYTDDTIYFDGSASYDPDGIITIFNWNFGDGSKGSGVTPTHTYSIAGNYTITLTVTDNENNNDIDITYAIIEGDSIEPSNLKPISNTGGPYYGYIDETINFDGSNSYDPDGLIIEYKWDFGDGSTDSGMTPTHTYTYDENYTVTLTVTDDEGKIDFDTTYANISKILTDPTNMIPNADTGGPYYEIINIPITFDGTQSFDSDGSIIEYIWDFGDGHTGIGEIVTHEYIREGRYDISLKVIDNIYDFHINNSYVIITDKPNYPPYKPEVYGNSSISINKLQSFEAESKDLDGDDIKYYFDWGDGSSITETEYVSNGTIIQSNHSWKFPGLYQLRVYVEDENGARSDITVKNILVDSIFCNNIGLLIDYSNDGVYDFFQSNITYKKTSTILEENSYLIDTNGDKKWDYIFDANIGILTSYSTNSDWLFDLANIPLYYLAIFIIITIDILALLFFYHIIRKKLEKKSIYFIKEKASEKDTKEKIKQKTKEEKIVSKDIKIDEIEKRIDELIGIK